jgi:hypothetical protein
VDIGDAIGGVSSADIDVSTGSASFLAGIGVVDAGFSIICNNSAEGSAIFFPKFIC